MATVRTSRNLTGATVQAVLCLKRKWPSEPKIELSSEPVNVFSVYIVYQILKMGYNSFTL